MGEADRFVEWVSLNGTVQRLWKSQRAFDVQRGTLEAGEGVGRDTIRAFSDGVLTEREVKEALSTLKATGAINTMLEELQAEIEAEEAEAMKLAEVERKRAERAEAEARRAAEEADKHKSKAEAARQREAEAREKASAELARKRLKDAEVTVKRSADVTKTTKAAHPQTLGKGIAQVMQDPVQLEAFRTAISTEASRHFFQPAVHADMAKQAIKDLSGNGGTKRVTAQSIRGWVSEQVAKASGAERKLTSETKAKMAAEQAINELRSMLDNMSGSMRSAVSYATKVQDLVAKHPTAMSASMQLKAQATADTMTRAAAAFQKFLKSL
jgi:hypothetical protein